MLLRWGCQYLFLRPEFRERFKQTLLEIFCPEYIVLRASAIKHHTLLFLAIV
jgi:hypothetical protein